MYQNLEYLVFVTCLKQPTIQGLAVAFPNGKARIKGYLGDGTLPQMLNIPINQVELMKVGWTKAILKGHFLRALPGEGKQPQLQEFTLFRA